MCDLKQVLFSKSLDILKTKGYGTPGKIFDPDNKGAKCILGHLFTNLYGEDELLAICKRNIQPTSEIVRRLVVEYPTVSYLFLLDLAHFHDNNSNCKDVLELDFYTKIFANKWNLSYNESVVNDIINHKNLRGENNLLTCYEESKDNIPLAA